MDRDVLEVYKGFNKSPLCNGERFKYLEADREVERNGETNKYYPVRLVASSSFDSLRNDFEGVAAWVEWVR